MKKFFKNSCVRDISIAVIAGLILSFINDFLRNLNLFSTLKIIIALVFRFISTVLNLNLKVWWILSFVVFFMLALFIFSKILDIKAKHERPTFLDYTRDSVSGYSWEWEYEKDYNGKYTIRNLHPVCSKCGMRLKQSGQFGLYMVCLRCNTEHKWHDSYLTNAQLLIEDNIRKNHLQKR